MALLLVLVFGVALRLDPYKDGKVWLIDFQGLRRGRQEYDLASLIFDPYMNHSAEEREALLRELRGEKLAQAA